jgi:hypothetical protein
MVTARIYKIDAATVAKISVDWFGCDAATDRNFPVPSGCDLKGLAEENTGRVAGESHPEMSVCLNM